MLTIPLITGKPPAGKMPEEQPPKWFSGQHGRGIHPPGTRKAHPGPTGVSHTGLECPPGPETAPAVPGLTSSAPALLPPLTGLLQP